jgi:hypothetical protein
VFRLGARAPRTVDALKTRGAESTMTETRFVKFVSGHYWVTIDKTGEHPYEAFQDRHEIKVWLDQHGVDRSVAEDCLIEAHAGTVIRVLSPG